MARKFDTPEEMEALIEEYWMWCEKNPIIKQEFHGKDPQLCEVRIKRPFTVEGLALALGYRRKTLHHVREMGEPYVDIIDDAIERITQQKVEQANAGQFNHHFTKFDLVNNSDYKDKTEQKIETTEFKVGFEKSEE